MKNCLVVLGMHRSGTSALTGVLGRLGVDLGDELMGAAPDNPRGFFENTFVVDTNDALLAALGASWDAPFALPTDWQSQVSGGLMRDSAARFLRDKINPGRLYALKDPRLSRLLPWWQALFTENGISGRYVILVRHPLEVAASLAERNDFSTQHSLLLWAHHMLDAQHYTHGLPRVFVHYDDLLQDPAATAQRLYTHCELPFPDNLEQALSGFIENDMRHHVADDQALRRQCPTLVADLYRELTTLSRAGAGAAEPDRLEQLEASFRKGLAMYHSPELARAFGDRRRLPDNLDDFLASPPWRLYRWYQDAVYRYLPEGTPLRTFLQRAKKALLARPD